MKLNKKGFTLVELLAVVVILLAITVMAVSSISAAIERNKAKQNKEKQDLIVSYAKIYYGDHKNSINKNMVNNRYCLAISKLDLDDAEIKDADGNLISGSVLITNNSGNISYEYVSSSDCS